MRKILTIAWKEIYTTFTDRNLVLIMVASPLVLSTIVALAFGGLGSGDVPIADIPIAVVNHDQPGPLGFSYGSVFVSLLVPGGTGSELELPACQLFEQDQSGPAAVTLFDLTEAVEFDETTASSLVASGELDFQQLVPGNEAYVEGVARAAVDKGIYNAALIIPADFTQRISYLPMIHPRLEQTGISVYANSGSPISSEVVRSIAEGITNQIAAGNIAMASSFEELQASYGPASLGQVDFESAFSCAFSPAGNTVGLDMQTVQGSSEGGAGRAILVFVGSAQAMFFALFTAQFGVLGLHNERRQGTLQRMVVSPTPRSAILAGNLGGVFLTVVFQLLVLILALALVGSVLQGKFDFIWGDNLLLLAGLLLAVALAVSGFGILLAAIVRSPEQGNILAPITNMALGVLGGAFGFTLPRIAGVFSLVYWGREAFQKLAGGDTDIGLNLLVLVIQGGLMYLLGVWLFNRRFEVA
ncbi:MAG: ABC transporter permease [Anaerolineales bacterium]